MCGLAKDTQAGLVGAGLGISVGLHVPGVMARDGRVASVRETRPALRDLPEQHRPCPRAPEEAGAGVGALHRNWWLIPQINVLLRNCHATVPL